MCTKNLFTSGSEISPFEKYYSEELHDECTRMSILSDLYHYQKQKIKVLEYALLRQGSEAR